MALQLLVILVAGAVTAFVLSCNVHEIAHAAVGTAFGWEVERIDLCLPGGGAVHYRESFARGDTIESWAGGLAGAITLLGVYGVLIGRRSGATVSPRRCAAGAGLVVPVGPQLVIAALEGTSGAADYTESISESPALWVTVLVLAALAAPIACWARWRSAGRDAPA